MILFLNQYYKNIIIYNLINKFNYKNIKEIPQIKKIFLNFRSTNSDIKQLTTSLLALELITGQKGKFIQAKKSNIIFKIRKGNPIGCKILLQKQLIYIFVYKLIFEIIPKIKTFDNLSIKKNVKCTKTTSLKITNILTFIELETNYTLFSNLKDLHIVLLTNTRTQNELLYLLNSFKLIIHNEKI